MTGRTPFLTLYAGRTLYWLSGSVIGDNMVEGEMKQEGGKCQRVVFTYESDKK